MKQTMTLFTALLLCSAVSEAQTNWEVNPLDYQYTMTVTGIGLYNCEESSDPNDRVAAFIDGECRGVANFDTDINGQSMAYLTVYGHTPAGFEINFKLYKASENEITDALVGLPFSDGSISGNAGSPFKFQNQFALSEIYIPADSLLDYYSQGTMVSEMFVINEAGDTLSANFNFINDEQGIDNESFSISTSTLILQESINYAEQDLYVIHIEGISEFGCRIDEMVLLPVFNTNVPPLGLLLDTFAINENEPVGAFVGLLEADDPTPEDSHTFTFYELPDPNPDRYSFEISNADLLTTKVLDYETQKSYHLAIEITDLSGNKVVDTLLVNVLDVIEFEDLKSSNLITPNADGFNDAFEIPNVYLFQNYELLIYNSIGNKVFDSQAYDNSWQGKTNNGVDLPTGTYYYVFQEISNNQNRFEGELHLYRENKF